MLHNSNQSVPASPAEAKPMPLLEAKEQGFLVRCQWQECGKSLVIKLSKQRRGPAPKYCSRSCQSKAYRAKKRHALAGDQAAQEAQS